jgi:hypothetical protein
LIANLFKILSALAVALVLMVTVVTKGCESMCTDGQTGEAILYSSFGQVCQSRANANPASAEEIKSAMQFCPTAKQSLTEMIDAHQVIGELHLKLEKNKCDFAKSSENDKLNRERVLAKQKIQ